MKILHVTAHLGGGVGKALSGLATMAINSKSGIVHSFICLEKPEKYFFADKIRGAGCEVFFAPSKEETHELVAHTDILQVEWWNHPATIECLCGLKDIPIRLLIWCHVSGLHTPVIPQQLIQKSHKFLFTSPCSYEGSTVKEIASDVGEKLDVVSSCGGFEGLPYPDNLPQVFSAGYIGSFNFTKLHPQFIDFLAAIDIPGIKIKMIGDLINKDILEKECRRHSIEGILDFKGYVNDIVSELKTITVMPYLLNPDHYGTTENALLEAMAMGIIPVALNNPTEQNIIKDQSTGLIVKTPQDFAVAMRWLYENPEERQSIGRQAADAVRQSYSAEVMEISLNRHYETVSNEEKRKVNFQAIFGEDPASWFLSCQENRSLFSEDGSIHYKHGEKLGYGLFDSSKGTVFHYSQYFPQDTRLRSWAGNLNSIR